MTGPVERLRAAEQRLRDVAGAATPGPWVIVPVNGITRADVRAPGQGRDHRGEAIATAADSEFGACSAADARYIAALAPPVALTAADWLAATADGIARRGVTAHIKPAEKAAIRFADAVMAADGIALGTES